MGGYGVDDRKERKRDWLFVLATAPAFAVVCYFATRAKALETSAALGLFYVLISRMWERRREKWFWVALSIFGLIHLAVIAFVPVQLPPGPSLAYVLPAMMVDGFAMYSVLCWLETKYSEAGGERD